MVNYLASCDLNEEWQFGKEPYSRAAPPPLVSRFLFLFLSDFFIAESVLSDLTSWLWSEPPPAASSRHRGAGQSGAGSSAPPNAQGGGKKCRAGASLFSSRPKKPKGSAAATKRDEAAAKANRFRKVVKTPQLISA